MLSLKCSDMRVFDDELRGRLADGAPPSSFRCSQAAINPAASALSLISG